MSAEFPRALAVTALAPYQLEIRWSTGKTLPVDLEERLRASPALAHVLDPKVFARARASDGGATIEWDDAELGADNVYAWTREQRGEMSHEMFYAWMQRHGLSLTKAADALGLSRRMVSYYRSGQRPIPKTVWLACRGWEAEQAA